MNEIIIAIDGPSATGKGTIASHIASYYGIEYLDTGIYYRTIAFLMLENNINIEEEEKIIEIARNMHIIYRRFEVFLGERNISKEIRSNEVNAIVSQVSAIKEVRLIVNEHIYDYTFNKDCVVDGRDITTTVFPNAKYKFYLDAELDERARRRFNQNMEMGITCTFEEILANLQMRDLNDKTKEYGALSLASDAIIINTTNKTFAETIKEIINIIGSELR